MPVASSFLKITNAGGHRLVDGESEEHDFEATIEVTGWSWGISDKQSVQDESDKGDKGHKASKVKPRGEGETGQALDVMLFSFTKSTDRATIPLISAMENGTIFPIARFSLRQEWKVGHGRYEAESKGLFLLHVELYDVIVSSLRFSARSAEFGVEFDEDWEFNYRTLKILYDSAGRYTDEFVRPPDSKAGSVKKLPPDADDEWLKKYRKLQAEGRLPKEPSSR